MPMEFRKNFGKECARIIDCFEVNDEKPTRLRARAKAWSSSGLMLLPDIITIGDYFIQLAIIS
ncbi:hypothetical protein DPMN_091919 [Dreissena polymorpha]|uniref:Uncharacterized protein n=1 Tax=Dreissena polymorpha TaxID=45954 RepID=A0A9D4L0Q4_DREPO|nr:hypothetical protein DPMN_091919 [Dreissena polymorpha]